jgi:hypothetical protein
MALMKRSPKMIRAVLLASATNTRMRPVHLADCGFNQATLHPAEPIKCHREHAENTVPHDINSL